MIFVTLGSQKFQFNRLLKKIDDMISKGLIREEVFAQIGYSDYEPKNYTYTRFLEREDFFTKIEQSNLVITHGGTGAIISAFRRNKRVVAVPRLARYGEHVDDHQLQLLQEFDKLGIVTSCVNLDELDKAIFESDNRELKEYHSGTASIIESIDSFLA